jgi:hypothetical protein
VTRAENLQHLATAITALVEPRTSIERVRTGYDRNRHAVYTNHTVTLPPLLTALSRALQPGTNGGDRGRTVPGSRPPLDTDALSLLHDIHRGVWIYVDRYIAENSRRTGSTEHRLRQLAAFAIALTDDELQELTAALRRWVATAELVTREVDPPFRPDAPCPACDRRHGLRIYVTERDAYCAHCRTTWDADTIGILGSHVSRWTEERISA